MNEPVGWMSDTDREIWRLFHRHPDFQWTPRFLALNIDRSRGYVNARCRGFHIAHLVTNPDTGVYEVSEFGEDYINYNLPYQGDGSDAVFPINGDRTIYEDCCQVLSAGAPLQPAVKFVDDVDGQSYAWGEDATTPGGYQLAAAILAAVEGEKVARDNYQAFADTILADLGDTWSLSRADVDDFLGREPPVHI